MKKIKLLFVLAALGVCSTLFAQTADRPWTLSLFGVKTEYLGDLRVYDGPTSSNLFNHSVNTIFNFDMNHGGYLGGGLQISRYLNRFFDLGLYASYSSIGFDYYDAPQAGFETRRNFHVDGLINGNLNFRFKFLGNDNYKVVPYITVGAGGLYYMNPTHNINTTGVRDGFGTGEDNFAPTDHRFAFEEQDIRKVDGEEMGDILQGLLTAGLGVEVKLTDLLSLRYQADLGWTTSDRVDGWVVSDKNDWQLQHTLGLSFNFGAKKDADGDGVKDKKDQCPDTPAGVAVDENGCPVDTDGDGVADYVDGCPNEAGTVNGCPDADGDGVADKDDTCPDTPAGATVDATGCPIDTDKDGVADYLDKCPNTPASAKVDTAGCPVDTDSDGIADYLDKCINEAGLKEYEGCPKPKAVEVTEVFKEQNLLFDLGRATIRTTSNTALDEAARIMKTAPTEKFLVVGHTDRTGSEATNLSLSQRRAAAVVAALEKRGVNPDQLKSIGKGESEATVAETASDADRQVDRKVVVKSLSDEEWVTYNKSDVK
jgi:outer membrane protein OmpA-like peptidoglycan-associated protein